MRWTPTGCRASVTSVVFGRPTPAVQPLAAFLNGARRGLRRRRQSGRRRERGPVLLRRRGSTLLATLRPAAGQHGAGRIAGAARRRGTAGTVQRRSTHHGGEHPAARKRAPAVRRHLSPAWFRCRGQVRSRRSTGDAREAGGCPGRGPMARTQLAARAETEPNHRAGSDRERHVAAADLHRGPGFCIRPTERPALRGTTR